MTGARLDEADLQGAYLEGAQLEGADLSEADLEGADLSGAVNVTQAQIDSAFTNEATKLPPGLNSPRRRRALADGAAGE